MARLPIYVPNKAGRARDPQSVAILTDVAPLNRRTRTAREKLFRVLSALGNVVRESDVHGGALLQLILGVTQHLAECRIDVCEAFVEAHDTHSDGRFGKDLAEPTLTRFQRRRPGGDGAHFPDATQTRDDEKNIFKDNPASVF